jgi:phage terminase large subunit-like protein
MAELNFQLLKWQQQVFKDNHRFKVVAAGRRCGKSRLSAVTLLIEGLNCPDGSAVMYVAPTLGQARTIIWDLLHELGRPIIKSSHVNNLEITLVNGKKILVRGADNPDSLRGVSLTYLVLDECAFIKVDVWEKILRAALSDKKGRALFISTPSGRNWFYDTFNLGQYEPDEEGYDEEWKSWHFTTQDNETIDPKEIEAAKRTLSSFAFKQEYLSSFDNAGADLFKEEWLKYSDEPEGSYVIAIDLAGFENVAKNAGSSKRKLDESSIAIVKITDQGDWWVKDIVHGRWDIRETAARILMAIRDHQPIAVGIERGALRNAVQPYLEDLMRKNNTYAHIHDLTHGNKKKTDRVIWALQGRFEHGRIKLNKKGDFKEFIDQYLLFPTTGVHDDLIDSLAYVDQLSIMSYISDYEQDEYEVMDDVIGW